MPRDRLYPALCALLVIVSVFATIPILEMGTNDDWSYIWVARMFATTGHLVYNGWIGAMIGFQAVWAALLIRIFGFSFTLVRLSTLPFAAGCAVLLYRLFRGAGLNTLLAMFGTLTVVLSPLFIPLAASFMTDVPGFFFWLASVYCAILAANAQTDHGATAWMAACAIAGAMGGTVRQVVWIVPLVVLPAAAYVRRRDPAAVIEAAVSWCITALAMALCLRWLAAQPYNLTPFPYVQETWLETLEDAAESILQIAQACLVFLLPVTVLYLALWRPTVKRMWALFAGFVIVSVLFAGVWWLDWDLLMGNIVTSLGMLHKDVDLLGAKPETLDFASSLDTRGVGVQRGHHDRGVCSCRRADTARRGDAMRWLVAVRSLYSPPCLVYSAALVYRSVTVSFIFDRYCLELLPLFIAPLLWYFQQHVREKPSRWAWATLVLFSLYGVGATHDYLAACRARLDAATAVVASGEPRNRVSAGFEYDGWTELQQTGHVTTEPPAGERRYPVSPPYWFWAYTPHIVPEYILVYSRINGLADSQFPATPFSAWIPPFHRQVLTQKSPMNEALTGSLPSHKEAGRRPPDQEKGKP